MSPLKRSIASLLSISILVLGLQGSLAQAGMIGTGSALEIPSLQLNRDQVADLLQREDVQMQMQALGIDAATAQERVAHLSNEELAQLNTSIDSLPAGSSVVGIAVIVLLTLVFLDIFGVTDIFTFIKPAK